MVACAGWHKRLVPEGENFINVGSFEFVKFLPRNTKLGIPVHYEKRIMALYKKLTLVERARNFRLYLFFQVYRLLLLLLFLSSDDYRREAYRPCRRLAAAPMAAT